MRTRQITRGWTAFILLVGMLLVGWVATPAGAIAPTPYGDTTPAPTAPAEGVAETTPGGAADTTPPSVETTPPSVETTPPVSATTPPCEDEDSPGPCRWDAHTMGNGQGESFTVDADGRVTYDAPTAPAEPWSVTNPWAPVSGYHYTGDARVIGGGVGVDAYGLPRHEDLPACDTVGTDVSCVSADGYRIIVWEDCSRMIINDIGQEFEPDAQVTECSTPDGSDTMSASTAEGEHSPAASATVAPAADEHAVQDGPVASPTELPAAPAAPAAPSGELAHTGLDIDYMLVIMCSLAIVGWVVLDEARRGRTDRKR